jgi:hypothetical protein
LSEPASSQVRQHTRSNIAAALGNGISPVIREKNADDFKSVVNIEPEYPFVRGRTSVSLVHRRKLISPVIAVSLLPAQATESH